jgi:hypothetical protein
MLKKKWLIEINLTKAENEKTGKKGKSSFQLYSTYIVMTNICLHLKELCHVNT